MSSIANWAYKSPYTFWRRLASDEYGQAAFELAYVKFCAYEKVSAITPDGAIPAQSVQSGEDTVYLEVPTDEEEPKVGWMMDRGTHSGLPTEEAKEVRSVTRYDTTMFGETVPDYKVMAR